jgi:hypothetical protein
MAKTSTERMRDKRERDEYSDEESQISINRSFASRLARLLKGTPEAAQLECLITQNRERIKAEYFDNEHRPVIS